MAANFSEQTTSHPFRGKDINGGFRIFILFVGTIILITGVLGNILLLVAQIKRRREKRFHNIFIGNLAAADLVVICTAVPFFLVDLVTGHNPVVNHLHCSVNAFVLCVGYAVSILTLVVVSFHRYMKVCHRFLFDKLFSTRKDRAICLALWLIAAVLNAPLFGLVPEYGYDSGSRLCNARGGRVYPCYGSVAMICMLVVPVLLIGFFNVAIFRIWYGSRRKLKNRRRQEKVAKATLKSFQSVSVDNITDSENRAEMVNNTDIVTETSLHNSDSFSELTSSTANAASSDCTGEMKDIIWPVLPQHDTSVYAKTELTRNTIEESATTVKAFTTPCMSSRVVTHSKAASISVDTLIHSHNPEEGSRKEHTKMRRVSFVCDALDLKTLAPSSNIATFAGDEDVIETSTAQEDEGTSASAFEVAEMTECNSLPETDSKPVNLDTPDVDQARTQKKKSVYPGSDRRRGKPARYKKPSASELALVRSLLVISICLFVLYTPFIITLILTFIIHHHLPAEVSVMSSLLLFVNCAINWAVYGVMNTAFRQAYVTTLKNFWRCCLRFRHRPASSMLSTGPSAHRPN